MADDEGLRLFRARSQLQAHYGNCQCTPCRDARRLLHAAAAAHLQGLLDEANAATPEPRKPGP